MQPLPPAGDGVDRKAPEYLARKRAERRVGVWIALAGVAIAVGALALQIRVAVHAPHRPQMVSGILVLVSMWVFGFGLHRAMWAPRGDPGGVPGHVRPWLSATFTLFTWWALVQVAALVGAALQARGR
jgi:hypothetical protein